MIALLYDLLFLLPFSLVIALASHPYLAPGIPAVYAALICLAAGGTGLALKHSKMKVRISLAGIWSAAFLIGIYFWRRARQGGDFVFPAWVLQELLLMTACFLLLLLMQRYRIFRLFLAFGGMALLGLLAYFGVAVEKQIVVPTILFFLLSLSDVANRTMKKEGQTRPEAHLVSIAPLWIAALGVIFFLKVPEKPYDWAIFKQALHSADRLVAMVGEEFGELFGGGNTWESDDAHIGFSTGGSFYNTLTGQGYPALELTPLWENDPIVLLSGKSFDQFDGREWTKSPYPQENEREMDALETLSWAMGQAQDMPIHDVLRKNSFWIKPLDIKTQCLFLPSKTLPGRGPERAEDLEIAYEGEDAVFTVKSKSHKKYCVAYYQLNRNEEGINRLKGPVREVTRESWEAAIEESDSYIELPNKAARRKPTYEEYLDYHDRIKKRYLPKTELSQQADAFLDELLEGAESDYEKLERIESILRKYSYTAKPGQLPKTVGSSADFLDYVLFEQKEGYCSHFATAFILMARASGIPARYVQGFRSSVYMRSTTEVSSEAYLEGIGWVPFEPTPGYRKRVIWRSEQETAEEEALIKEARAQAIKAEQEREEELARQLDEQKEISGQVLTESFWQKHSRLVLFAGLAGALFALLMVGLEQLIRRIRYAHMSQRDKGLYLCKRQMEFLSRKKDGRANAETLQEYVLRARKSGIPGDVAFCGVYEKLLYTEFVPSDEDLAGLWQSFRKLKKQYRKKAFFIKKGAKDGN